MQLSKTDTVCQKALTHLVDCLDRKGWIPILKTISLNDYLTATKKKWLVKHLNNSQYKKSIHPSRTLAKYCGMSDVGGVIPGCFFVCQCRNPSVGCTTVLKTVNPVSMNKNCLLMSCVCYHYFHNKHARRLKWEVLQKYNFLDLALLSKKGE